MVNIAMRASLIVEARALVFVVVDQLLKTDITIDATCFDREFERLFRFAQYVRVKDLGTTQRAVQVRHLEIL